MGRTRVVLSLTTLILVVAACDSGASGISTTTTTAPAPATTTTTPPATTTTEQGPCPDHPFCVIYEIRPEATWSDGEPVTAEDFIHTFEVLADPVAGAADGSGYDMVRDVVALDDKTVLVGLSRVYPPWRELFGVVLPAHYTGPPGEPGAPVSGPFALDEWVEGERITLRRNPSYWSDTDPVSGGPGGDVAEIVFVFGMSVRDRLAGLERGEIDVAAPPRPLGWMVEELEAMEGVSHELVPGPFWEHIDFNHDDPLLSQRWVREVIALAIDREAMLDETARTVDPAATGLDSAVWMQGSPHYRDNYHHAFDPVAAEEILAGRFCEKDEGGIYNCQGRRMSFTWATTSGDEYRERIFEIAREGLGAVGIELIPDLRLPSELFSQGILFGGPEVWQMINFSWRADVDPHLANPTFYCEGDAPSGFGSLNVARYCDDEVEALIRSTDRILDPGERASAYNEADRLYLGDLAVIPLFQKPALLAWRAEVAGPDPNVSAATHLWNVGAWAGKDRVVVALESEPDTLDPVRPPGESAEAVLAAILHGAYSVDPSLQHVPVLVSGATPVLGDG